MFVEDLTIFFADFAELHTIDSASVLCIVGEKVVSRADLADNWNRESALGRRPGIEGAFIESFEITVKKDDIPVFIPTQGLTLDNIDYTVGAYRDDGGVVMIHLSRLVS